MKLTNILLISSFSFVISSCTNWSIHGNGGLAEHYVETQEPIVMTEDFTAEKALRLDINNSERQLEILILRGAPLCFPAAVKIAQDRQNRTKREFVGGLHLDAANSLIDQKRALVELDERMSSLKVETCSTMDEESNEKMMDSKAVIADFNASENKEINISKLEEDMNKDNLFAFNSEKINPKYAKRLETAAKVLIEYQNIIVTIIGHTDPSGNSEYNYKLSNQRATQVYNYLIQQGISKNRLHISFKGATEPRYSGRADEIDLANRRVHILLSRLK